MKKWKNLQLIGLAVFVVLSAVALNSYNNFKYHSTHPVNNWSDSSKQDGLDNNQSDRIFARDLKQNHTQKLSERPAVQNIKLNSQGFQSIEYYKSKFINVSEIDLINSIKTLDSKISELKLIERANVGTLSSKEMNQFGEMLSERAAAKLISIRRRLDSHT